MKISKVFKLIFSLGICQFAGVAGSLFTASAIPTWYAALEKPSFSPPNWIFGPVWVALYFLMGIALYLIWKRNASDMRVKTAVTIFFIHLFFNAIWSVLFFGTKNPFWAFVDIILLWSLIVVIIILFLRIYRIAAYLLTPYLIWVTFATVLNFFIWRLN